MAIRPPTPEEIEKYMGFYTQKAIERVAKIPLDQRTIISKHEVDSVRQYKGSKSMKNLKDQVAGHLSAEDLRVLADQKEKESKPVKTGILKHDLYQIDECSFEGIYGVTLSEMEKYKKQIEKLISKIVSKGDTLVCFLHDGKECWFDDNGWIEDMDEAWAKANLENIQDV